MLEGMLERQTWGSGTIGRCLDLGTQWSLLPLQVGLVVCSILCIWNDLPSPFLCIPQESTASESCGCTIKAKHTYTEQLHESFCRDSSERSQASFSDLWVLVMSRVNWNSQDPAGQGLLPKQSLKKTAVFRAVCIAVVWAITEHFTVSEATSQGYLALSLHHPWEVSMKKKRNKQGSRD